MRKNIILFIILSVFFFSSIALVSKEFIEHDLQNREIKDKKENVKVSSPDDLYEPNDYFYSPYDLSTDEQTWLSTINGPGYQEDDDWYEIYVNSGEERLIVNVIFTHSEGDIDIGVYDNTGLIVTYSLSSSDNEYINDIVLDGNEYYYINVFGNNASNEYDLWWDDVEVSPPTKDWTFMVYLDGDNNLESDGIDDFLEMSSIGSTDDVNIITQFDRTVMEDDSFDDWEDTLRFYITKGMCPYEKNCIEDLNECNMGNPSTLSDFINWGITNYPAEKYALILWDHGAGWTECCNDDDDYDELTMEEIYQALSDSYDATGIKINLTGFDACLMAMAEVDYQIKDWCQVRVGSQETEPGEGWPYEEILYELVVDSVSMTPYELGALIVEKYIKSYPFASEETQSCTNLTQYNSLASEINDFSIDLKYALSKNLTEILEARLNAEYIYYTDFIDLYDFAKEIYDTILNTTIQNSALDLMKAINKTVINEAHGDSYHDLHGISIYFPTSSEGYENYYEDALNFTTDLAWDEFLIEYNKYTPGDKYEPNNHPFDPFDLSLNESDWLHTIDGYGIQGSEDWYNISVRLGFERLIVELLFNHSEGDIDIMVLYFDGSDFYLVAYSVSTTDNEYIDYVMPLSGYYYLRIYGENRGNKYDLRWNTFKSGSADDDDNNDDDNGYKIIPGYNLIYLMGTLIGIILFLTIIYKRRF